MTTFGNFRDKFKKDSFGKAKRNDKKFATSKHTFKICRFKKTFEKFLQ